MVGRGACSLRTPFGTSRANATALGHKDLHQVRIVVDGGRFRATRYVTVRDLGRNEIQVAIVVDGKEATGAVPAVKTQ